MLAQLSRCCLSVEMNGASHPLKSLAPVYVCFPYTSIASLIITVCLAFVPTLPANQTVCTCKHTEATT